ncbi:LacI family transcriptional regulator [Humibacillus xanthopallidus]|uniref:LacI family transcriptional regulator n=2 Tax=Humibacillus xanthopallidus TaxID=412689 RepID=A0A543PKI1_9MICO|nr:LacI family transcriptional regulator [Humibacillus xanthopallidus]
MSPSEMGEVPASHGSSGPLGSSGASASLGAAGCSASAGSAASAGAGHHVARATMKDVAALSGVSLKTVSRVVNREAGVSPEVRERVERAVARLDYSHNVHASNLRRSSGRTGTVGALLQDISNSFSASLLRSLEDVARDQRTAVLASSLDEEPEREIALVRGLVARRVDGLVLMPATARQEYLLPELRAGLPTVFVDRLPRGVDADSVTVDNLAGSRHAVRHLVSHGHRRIVALGDLRTIQTAELRLQGYREEMQAAGLGDEILERADLRTPEAAEAAVRQLFRTGTGPRPTAIFAGRNDLAVGAVRALRALGLVHRVALVGFDDFPLADLLDPGLTVMRQNVGQIGSEVGRLLFARIDGDAAPPRRVVIEPTLIPRGSGEIPPHE